MDTRELIKKHNIRLVKSLGQNFLTDDRVVERIVDAADVNKNDLVLEIGPGVGSMTGLLAQRAGGVVAVEIDRHLIVPLKEKLKDFDNTEVINDDILKVDINKLINEYKNKFGTAESVKVVANLPYYITTPVIMKILEDKVDIEVCVFMVQKEVADRMVANPGGKDYGALSVAVQYRSKPEKVFDVPPHCFIPQPEVYSTVIKLDIYKNLPIKPEDENTFFRVVKASFGQRRKTLSNALFNSGYFSLSKEEIIDILGKIGVEPNRRGETLSILQFKELTNEIFLSSSR
ncbi:MAG: 16S rRNA (adenine(1518)-N(6)/adenine(1519)-N(6))-dimethyltransferase RsmA [Bacillota bacterium]|nr:16S rRNA (adenine(1518)-N(6)/adenine(1519)-N(6))-dimethyltransferase RsmA [Bacillota bacterium]